jgi:hypothetical protein
MRSENTNKIKDLQREEIVFQSVMNCKALQFEDLPTEKQEMFVANSQFSDENLHRADRKRDAGVTVN